MSMEQSIKAEAFRLGFSLAGITTPQCPPHYNHFVKWIQSGYHAGMAYLSNEHSLIRRKDPRIILPECRSLLVVAFPYPPVINYQVATSYPAGTIAAYALLPDYHDFIVDRLKVLSTRIETLIGSPVHHLEYVDTGAILERDFAQLAGLGWIGKNSCLIHPQNGSYFFLGEILLGIGLQADSEFMKDHCGTCHRCIDACPTACILPNRTVDASRCISYLTIENKVNIPQELRSNLGDRIFGCDLCQEVCPWNRHATSVVESSCQTSVNLAHPDLRREIHLSQEDFYRKFKGTPIMRAKRRGYLRNVAVALGNTHNTTLLPGLQSALNSEPEALVRVHLAWSIGEIGGRAALQVLQAALPTEENAEVRQEIEKAMDRIKSSYGRRN